MEINKTKLLLAAFFLFACIFISGFYLIKKYNSDSQKKVMFFAEQNVPAKENLEVEIINEAQDRFIDDKEEEAEEIILEDDVEKLSVIEEAEKTNAGEAEAENYQGSLPTLPSPLEKKRDPDTLRIGLITDLHAQSDNGKGLSLGNYYSKKINYFIEKMNNNFSPNFILLNGDVIEGTRTNSEVGSRELSLVKKFVDRTIIKKYWVAGNHDLRSVSKKQWMENLGIDYMSKSFDVGNYKIIILDSNFTKEDLNVKPGIDYMRGKVSQKQMEWLKRELEKTSKKVIVFMHHPPLRDIDAKINLNLLYNAKELQAILSQYGALAVFSGHIEDLYYQEIEGVKYFVSPGMVKHSKYQGAFSEITIKKSKVSISFNYLMTDGKYRIVEVEKK